MSFYSLVCMIVFFVFFLLCFFFEWCGDHRGLHRVGRRQRQMCIRDSNMLVEGVDQENGVLIGRTYRDAPEIDGLVIAEGLSLIHISEPTRPY